MHTLATAPCTLYLSLTPHTNVRLLFIAIEQHKVSQAAHFTNTPAIRALTAQIHVHEQFKAIGHSAHVSQCHQNFSLPSLYQSKPASRSRRRSRSSLSLLPPAMSSWQYNSLKKKKKNITPIQSRRVDQAVLLLCVIEYIKRMQGTPYLHSVQMRCRSIEACTLQVASRYKSFSGSANP